MGRRGGLRGVKSLFFFVFKGHGKYKLADGSWKPTVPHVDDDRIGPCRVQQRRRSRAHQRQQGFQGLATLIMRSDQTMEVPCNLPPQETGDRVLGATNPIPPSPPSGQPGQGPTTPLHTLLEKKI